MRSTSGALPLLLASPPSTRRIPLGFEDVHLTEMRKGARAWLGASQSKLSKGPLVAALSKALSDDKVAERVLNELAGNERRVVAVYRRYGDCVDGEVVRLDLLARGLLEIAETPVTDYYTRRQWKRNPVKGLAECWILLPDHFDPHSYYYGGYGDETTRPFVRYGVHAGVARLVKPAGPPGWLVAPAEGTPHTISRRSSAEVALDLSRIFAFVDARAVKMRKDGVLSTPSFRAIEKGVPLGDDPEFPLPEPHTLYLEILRSAGAVRVEANQAVGDHVAAVRMFAQDDAWQAYSWRGWLNARYWNDGFGAPDPGDLGYTKAVETSRRVLAWALGCLAHSGDHWYELNTFLSALDSLQGDPTLDMPYSTLAWTTKITLKTEEGKPGQQLIRRDRRVVAWYANALMVTLVALGLVERGRLGRAANSPHVFRLSGLGRAVFGAPEVAPLAEPGADERRFLVVQPNFDLLAYVDQADAASAGLLGRMTETDLARTGPVQTFRLTQKSVYQAQESGLSHDQIVGFLQQHARSTLPPNVLRSIADWTGKRESLVLRSGTTLLGFPSEADRDAYLKHQPGTACGARFVLVAGSREKRLKLAGALVTDHLMKDRRTLKLDEHGRIQSEEPLDTVQWARLRRLATPTKLGWQLGAESIRQAAAAGMKPPLVHRWLSDHLAKPMPPLIAQAIDASMGKAPTLELADAVLLHVPEDEVFKAIAASPRLRPFLLDSPGSRWVLVRRESRKELAAALEELGFRIDKQLTLKGRTTSDGDGGHET